MTLFGGGSRCQTTNPPAGLNVLHWNIPAELNVLHWNIRTGWIFFVLEYPRRTECFALEYSYWLDIFFVLENPCRPNVLHWNIRIG